MFIAYLIVTVVTAAANVFSATLDFIRYKQISINMARVGVPESWMPLLGILKAAAAVGLLVGIGVPFVGASAALGLVCFFVGAPSLRTCVRGTIRLDWQSSFLHWPWLPLC